MHDAPVPDQQATEKDIRFLEKKLHELYSIFDVARQLKSSLDLEEIINYTTLTLMGHYGMEAVAVLLPNEENEGVLTPFFSRGLPDTALAGLSFTVDSDFGKDLIIEDSPRFFDELAVRFKGTPELVQLQRLSCIICVPLVVNIQLRGILTLGQHIFTDTNHADDDLSFLVTSSSLIAAAIENARYFKMAITDGLTKLFTRRYFQIRFDEEFKRSARYRNDLSVLMMDINKFKPLNDTYGHQAGDMVLRQVSDILRVVLRSIDFPARYGGDEFVVFLPETSLEGARQTIKRIHTAMEQTRIEYNGKVLEVTLSIGAANFPHDSADPEELVRIADQELYRVKNAARAAAAPAPTP